MLIFSMIGIDIDIYLVLNKGIPPRERTGVVARKGKVLKNLRNERDKVLKCDMPNIIEASHKMTPDELARHLQRCKQAGIKGKSTLASREREAKRRDRRDIW